MKVIVEYQGKRYEGIKIDEFTSGEVAEKFYKDFSIMDKFQMELAEGGSLLLGSRAIQSAVIMFIP